MRPGVYLIKGGAHVALISRHGTSAWYCDFKGGVEKQTALEKSGDWFTGIVRNVKAGDLYGFRVDGPFDPGQGLMFDKSKLLPDLYATRVSTHYVYNDALARRGEDTSSLVPKSVVETPLPDLPLRAIKRPKFIYELSVKSFTINHPDVPPPLRGTVAALAEPAIISYLQKLGVDAVELMPLHAWIDEMHLAKLGLHNAWGYNPVQYFGLDPRLCPGGWAELRAAVQALAKADINTILDVVYNHSGEGDADGPVISFRGLDNTSYYALEKGVLHNDTGCGNTLSLNTEPAMSMVLASLRHAILKAGVAGFRFDLAPVLGRGPDGFNSQAPLLKAIMADEVLASRVLIAEPWDIGPGGYRLGNFPSEWLEWNDQFRDGVRRFWRGDAFSANAMATRLTGSSDIFGSRTPSASVNFVAAHDGFTLRDLTVYSTRQNFTNGEGNRDGNAAEVTVPGGNVEALLASLFLSRGTIMLTAGDEFGRTQKGNNNAYAQDNETTWLDWPKRDLGLIGYTFNLSALRKELAPWFEDIFLKPSQATWFNATGAEMQWNNPANRFLGLLLTLGDRRLAIILNAGGECSFPLSAPPGKVWGRLFSSSTATDCASKSVSVFAEE